MRPALKYLKLPSASSVCWFTRVSAEVLLVRSVSEPGSFDPAIRPKADLGGRFGFPHTFALAGSPCCSLGQIQASSQDPQALPGLPLPPTPPHASSQHSSTARFRLPFVSEKPCVLLPRSLH